MGAVDTTIDTVAVVTTGISIEDGVIAARNLQALLLPCPLAPRKERAATMSVTSARVVESTVTIIVVDTTAIGRSTVAIVDTMIIEVVVTTTTKIAVARRGTSITEGTIIITGTTEALPQGAAMTDVTDTAWMAKTVLSLSPSLCD